MISSCLQLLLDSISGHYQIDTNLRGSNAIQCGLKSTLVLKAITLNEKLELIY